MQPTIEILERIRKNSRDNKEEIFTRLYRYLLRPDLYYLCLLYTSHFAEVFSQKLYAGTDAGNHYQVVGTMAEKASERPGTMKGAAYERYFSKGAERT